jgi:hypothetical protein
MLAQFVQYAINSCSGLFMKKSCKAVLVVSAVLILIGMPVAVKANTIVLTQNSNYSYGDGGEFTAVTTGQSFLGNGYAVSTLVNGGFQTFCVQNLVDFNPGVTYNYTTGNATGSNGTEGGISLSEGAAYLYYEFATGNLSGYNYTPGSGRVTTAGQLQAAIWYFMGEGLAPGFTTSDQFITLADNNLADPFAANGSLYGVEILQLTTPGSNPSIANQNQLVLMPVTDGGMTAAMLGMGLVGMFLIQFPHRKPAFSRI